MQVSKEFKISMKFQRPKRLWNKFHLCLDIDDNTLNFHCKFFQSFAGFKKHINKILTKNENRFDDEICPL